MKYAIGTSAILSLFSTVCDGAIVALLDGFDDGRIDYSITIENGLQSQTEPASVIGGFRRMDFEITNVWPGFEANGATANVLTEHSRMQMSPEALVDVRLNVIYDADGAGLNEDMTANGVTGLAVNFHSSDAHNAFEIEITDGSNQTASTAFSSPVTFGALTYDFPFADFSNQENVDFSNINKIEFIYEPRTSVDFSVLGIDLTGTPTGSGIPEPSTTLILQIGISALLLQRRRNIYK